MKNKLKKSVFLLSSLMMLSVGVGVTNGFGNNTVNVAEAATTASLSFADKANRKVFTTSQQVWNQNDITLTNDKSSSTSNVGNYANPARFYKSSKITVEAPGNITKLVFNCNSTTYATALKNSVKSTEGTVSVSSKAVTITPVSVSESFIISTLSGGQVRVDSLDVEYEAGEEISYDYYVTFYNEAGDELKTVGTNGETVEPYADQVKPGYNFIGWYEYNATESYDFTAAIDRDVELYPKFEEAPLSTIAEVLAAADSTKNYKVEGEVYAKTAYNAYYIQDETGGINLFGVTQSLTIGNTVVVSGSYATFYKLPELTSVELLEVTSDDTDIDTVPTTEITSDHIGQYVELNNITLKGSFANGVTSATSVTATDGTNNYTLRYISEYLDSDEDLTTFTTGTVVNVRGALSIYNTTLQILPTYIELVDMGQLDTPEVSFDEENSAIVWNAIEGASGYQVYVLNGAGEEVADEKVNGTSFDVSEFGNDSYSATVVALGNKNYSDSDEGEVEFTLNQGASAQVAVVETVSSLGFNYVAETEGDSVGGTSLLVAEDLGYENAAVVTSEEIDGVTYSFDKGSNSETPKYYNTGKALRLYGGNKLTLSAAAYITNVKLTFASDEGTNEITADKGTFTTDTWTGEASEVVFTIGGTKGHRRIVSIEVTYGSAAETTYTFSDVRVRFAATISADVYEGLNIEGAGFVVTAAGLEGTMNIDCTGKFAEDENGDYFIICSIWNIPELNYATELTATAYFVIDGETYYAQSTTHSVLSLVDAYMVPEVYNTLTDNAKGAVTAFDAKYSA